ncbi:MAG: type II CRISPR-associated endonuclease Cas1 [Kiritimatiellae bacterium]|nr:type II CRISPR-associated endonuclease Cas1 [Kiritimatiellia bacterium]
MYSTVVVETDSLIHVKDRGIVVEPLAPAAAFPPKSCHPEDIGVLVVEGLHSRISACALAMLAEAKTVVCVCDSRKMPVSLAIPASANTRGERVLKGQLAFRRADRVWKQIASAKIFNQSEHLRRRGCGAWAEVRGMSRKVRNGDAGNLEAVAAAKYFGALGIVRTTQRDEDNPMPNPALNYAYAIARSATARSLAAHGMLCAVGLHHDNMRNPFCLADDMMEPFRPLIDEAVLDLPEILGKPWRRVKMEPAVKKLLARTLYRDVEMEGGTFPMALAIDLSCASLAKAYSGEVETPSLPRFPA